MEWLDQVKDVRLSRNLTVGDLLKLYGDIHGFMAEHVYKAVEILKKMKRECDVRILAFTGNLIATGLRGVIAQLLEAKAFNVVITTCGAIDHDIARSHGGKYLKGTFDVDDRELYDEGLHRLGNVFIPLADYGPLIERTVFSSLREIRKMFPEKKVWGVREVLHEIGKRIDDENSILRAASKNNIPVFVPGFVDGAFGTSLFMFSRFNDFAVDPFKDQQELADIIFSANSIGALILGGGISKHHALWWSQFKEGLDYAVYVTTATEWDGSLSGARPREAITWGKLKKTADHVYVYGEVSIILPLLAYAVLYD